MARIHDLAGPTRVRVVPVGCQLGARCSDNTSDQCLVLAPTCDGLSLLLGHAIISHANVLVLRIAGYGQQIGELGLVARCHGAATRWALTHHLGHKLVAELPPGSRDVNVDRQHLSCIDAHVHSVAGKLAAGFVDGVVCRLQICNAW